METVLEHTVEPKVAPPPPRRIALPPKLAFLLTVAGLLLGLFVLGSGRALWEVGKLLWIGAAGRTVQGHIVEVRTEPSAVRGKPPIPVAVRFVVNIPGVEGTLQRQSGWVGLERPKGSALEIPRADQNAHPPPSPTRLPPGYALGRSFPVRYAPWFGGVASYPWRPSPAGRVTSLLLSGGLVLLVSLLLARRLVHWTRERLRLLRGGVATVGTITHKRTEADDVVRYYLRYGYAPAPGEGREREEQVSVEQWKEFEIGQPVTVLYDPNTPEQAGLYALIGHG